MLQTTQLSKSTIHYPMQHQLKSCFQMLQHKCLNKVVATDIYFASDKSIYGFYCAQFFFGMTSKSLFVVGMKTASEVPDVYMVDDRTRHKAHAMCSSNIHRDCFPLCNAIKFQNQSNVFDVVL
jgi:hypothetical protein